MSVQTLGCGKVTLWPDSVELTPGLISDRQSSGHIPVHQIRDIILTDASRWSGPGKFHLLLHADPRPLDHLTVTVGAAEESRFQALRLAILNAAVIPAPPPPPVFTPPPPPPPEDPRVKAIQQVHEMFNQGLITAVQRDQMINNILGLDSGQPY